MSQPAAGEYVRPIGIIKCPRCGSEATTVKTINPEGQIYDVSVKTEPVFFYDYGTGEEGIGNQYVIFEFKMFMCPKCVVNFGLVVKYMHHDKDVN